MRIFRIIRIIGLPFALITLFLSSAPYTLSAQQGAGLAQATILRPVVVTDHIAMLGVRVPFQLRDADGRSIASSQITNLRLRLLDMPPGAIATSTEGRAQRIETPMYVALLIDASGSMGQRLPATGGRSQTYLEAVRDAAKRAISSAPSQVQFRIVSFRGRDAQGNPVIELHQDFTNNRSLALSAIDRIVTPQGATCYYDSVYEALDALHELRISGDNTVRKAVIAFTDGDDRISAEDARPCSRRTIDEVIRTARQRQIGVHTIGIKNANDPTTIKDADLRRLAAETNALSAIGAAIDIDSLFSQVFAGLFNQYVADFEVIAKAGRNEAILEVRLNGVSELVKSPPFEFDSPRSFIPAMATPVPPSPTPHPTPTPLPAAPTAIPPTAMPPTTEVRFIHAPQPDGDRGVYVLSLSIGAPRIVDKLIIQTLDQNGVQINVQEVVLDGRPNLSFDIPFSLLKPELEHLVRVLAVDKTGKLIAKPQEQYRVSQDDETILAELKFKHTVEKPQPLTVAIRSVRPIHERGIVVAELDMNQFHQADKFQAFINNDAGQKVHGGDTGLQVYPEGQREISIPIPEEARQPVDNPQPQNYKLYLSVWTPQNERIEAAPYEFKLTPPTKPGFFATIWMGLEENPTISLGIVVVISSLTLWLVFSRRSKKPTFSLDRPLQDYTVPAGTMPGSSKKHGKLLIDVIETPSPGERVKHTVNRSPCVLGRSSKCDICLAGDSQLSRQHAHISLQNGQLTITDLGSNNGTFVDDEQLAPRVPTPLSDGQVIRLGRQTKIRVGVRY